MILFYHILVFLGFILVLPMLPFVWLISEKRRANLLQRMGIHTGIKRKRGSQKRIWIHALSVGEVKSSLPLVTGVKNRYPKTEIIFTASTRTGFDTAQTLFCGSAPPLVSQIAYFPFDLPWAVAKIRRLIEPDLVCLVETDLWPGFLHSMVENNIPVVLANARLSKKSFNRYRRLGPLAALFFSGLTHVLVQTRQDLERFNALGVQKDRLILAGNIKFDQPLKQVDKKQQASLKHWFKIFENDRLWLAGSTHPEEEIMLLSVFRKVRQKVPGLKLMIAPRDPARCRHVAKELAGLGCSATLLSQTRNHPENAQVMLMDCLGVLATAYAVCDAAFIGGSLVPCGGHNPLEPAMFKKPVLFGPHMDDFSGVVSLLLAHNAACRITNEDTLARALENLLTRPDQATDMGNRAFAVFEQNAGAVNRTLERLAHPGLEEINV
ncbi:MAG: 3-deoxy-D-manno-octulosonic acid transferase [Desulfotignum sp.]|nr:3-deoxy-D-manno-octulosonic acid transferase [Desulfotignum sp.]MCF8112816.1 3-deoxy-D-manno-octulosonic acid transferase [Desulfotignum sp.]MCF8124698.1 3-deoxy-D-manno-octulosonic acid transferase [Desulfotignum sp.]